jgi:hypothetical protein
LPTLGRPTIPTESPISRRERFLPWLDSKSASRAHEDFQYTAY